MSHVVDAPTFHHATWWSRMFLGAHQVTAAIGALGELVGSGTTDGSNVAGGQDDEAAAAAAPVEGGHAHGVFVTLGIICGNDVGR